MFSNCLRCLVNTRPDEVTVTSQWPLGTGVEFLVMEADIRDAAARLTEKGRDARCSSGRVAFVVLQSAGKLKAWGIKCQVSRSIGVAASHANNDAHKQDLHIKPK